MKITATKNTMADGKALRVGETVDVSGITGRLLINLGKAVEYVEPPKPPRKTKSKTDRMERGGETR